MKICVIGSCGHMGDLLMKLGHSKGHEMQGIDPKDRNCALSFNDSFEGDVIIDFSSASVLSKTLEFALKNKKPLVIAVTGYDSSIKTKIEEASKHIPIFVSANFSLGIYRLKKLIKLAQDLSDDVDIEIIDTHHHRKMDAPSGTSKELANVLGKDIPTHSLRMGTVVGDHSVIFAYNQERIEITHRAQSREVFAEGALNAAVFLSKQSPAQYSMDDLFKGE